MRLLLPLLGALLFLAGCPSSNGGSPDATSRDLGTSPPDSGVWPDAMPTMDAAELPDLGAGMDAAETPDLGAGMDALEAADALELPDAMEAPDAMELPDAMVAPDAAELPDAMEAPDAGPSDAGFVCGNGVRDPGERCDFAVDRCCNSTCDDVLSPGSSCRTASTSCDLSEQCDGLAPECPADVFQPDRSACTGCVATATTACLGCYSGACASYISPCLDILSRGLSVGDGIYDIPSSVTGTVALPVYCDMTTDGGGWTLLYKKSAAVPGYSAALWTGTPTNAQDRALLARGRSPRDYSSPLIHGIWPAFLETRVEVVTGTVAAKFLQFDTIGADTVRWFAPQRVTVSSWTDLPTSPTWENGSGRFFSIQGTTGRAWYINSTWGGCPSDTGWLMITHTNFCYWEGRSTDYPSEILYSTLNTIASEPNTNVFRRADALMVFAR